MPEILLTPELLRSNATKLSSQKQELDNAVKSIATLVDSLQGGWHGKAQATFVSSITEKKGVYDKFSADMAEFATFLNNYASAMETTDDGATSRLSF